MHERFGLRLRIFLFFALIAAGSVAALALAGVIVARHAGPDAMSDLVLGLGLAAFAIVGLCVWVWLKFDEHVARPTTILAAEIRSAVHAGSRRAPDAKTGRYLGLLAPAVREVIDALSENRTRTEAAIADAVADAARQKSRLETVLRDLQEGVVICTLDHRILLYNHHALQCLHVEGELGLGRKLLTLVAAQPIRHALQRLLNRFETGRFRDHPDGLTALVVVSTVGRHRQLRGRMGLTLDAGQTRPAGYVISFADFTNELSAGIWRDRLLQDVTQDMRRRITDLSLAAEVLLAGSTSTDSRLAPLEHAVRDEPIALAAQLSRLDEAATDLLAGAWPMADVLSPTLMGLIRERRSEQRDLSIEIAGGSLWLHCDSATVVDLADRLLNRVAIYCGVDAFRLATTRGEIMAQLDLSWHGDRVPLDVVEIWLDERLDEALGPVTGRDVLNRHKTDVWCQTDPDGWTTLRMPLALSRPSDARQTDRLPARPEFYDFELPSTDDLKGLGTPLKALTFVVFDTETTGLEPSRGDEIVQIAGVRVVNGRLLRGEVFDSYVDPGRRIPAASSRIHGITDEMVRGADAIDRVLPRFRTFVGEAVLVAHNAAFDMTFLNRHAARAGCAFEGPVLDTVLLAAHLFGATQPLTLDALAERFEVALPDEERHTALGDSIATARVLVRLFDLLEASGVRTLGEALAASERQVAIRRAQKGY